MNLDLKIQAIQPENIDKNSYSIAHQFTKPEDELLRKRGQLFLAMSISTDGSFDLPAATKLFIEHVNGRYYVLNEYSPLKNLEKSFKSGLNLLENFRGTEDSHHLGNPVFKTKISIAMALIWNRVLYTINLGDNANYIIRGSGARDMNIEPAEMVNINSLILEDDDVIMIGTEVFEKNFPVKTIIENLTGISQRMANSEDSESMSLVLIKVNEQKTEKKSKNKTPLLLHNSFFNYISNLKNKLRKEKGLSDEFEVFQSKKTTPISSISGLNSEKTDLTHSTISSKPIRINTKKQYSPVTFIVGLLLIIMLGIGGLFVYRESTIKPNPTNSQNISNNRDFKNSENQGISEKKPPEITAPLIIDIETLSKSINLSSYGLFGENKIIFYSDADNSVYIYDISKKERLKVDITSDNINKIRCFTKFCILASNEIIYVLDPNTPEKIDKYNYDLSEDIIDVSTYGTSGYLLTPQNIYTFRIGDQDPVFKSWITTADKLSGGRSMLINTDIYVLDNNIVKKYASGRRSNFDIKSDGSETSGLVNSIKSSLYLYSEPTAEIYKVNLVNGESTKIISLKDFGFVDTIRPSDIVMQSDSEKKVYIKYKNSIYNIDLPK